MTALAQGQQSSAIYLLRNAEPYDAVFNDPSHPAYVGGLAGDDGITGLDSPEVREAAADLVEADGGLHGNFWFSRRPVTITTLLTSPTISTREALMERVRRASNAMRQNASLFWFPGDPAVVATTRENLVTNPSFEWDAPAAPAVWTSLIDAAYTTTTFAARANTFTGSSGANTLRIKGTKDATATSRTIGASIPVTGLTAGSVYSARAKLSITDAIVSGTGISLKINWQDANGTAISTSTSNVIAVGSTGVQTVTLDGATAPTAATQATLTISGASTTSSDVVDFDIDAIQMIQEAAAGTYMDGDSSNSSWLGIRGQSTSVNRPNARLLTVRRQQPVRFSGIGWSKLAFIPLVAADPRIYSAACYDQTAAHATDMTVENQGDAESPPVRIRINGPGTTATIKHVANGITRNIVIAHTLTAGHWLDIDVVNRTVIDDTGASQYGKVTFGSTSWWGLMPGPSNLVRGTWTSGSTGASTTQLRWRDAWI